MRGIELVRKPWRDLGPGDTIRVRGDDWFIERITDGKFSMINKKGTRSTGAPSDLDREVDVIMEADPAVSALSDLAGTDPMQGAVATVRVVLGGVELGEQASDGSWSCPPEDGSDAVTLAVHRLMFHSGDGVTHGHRN